MSLDRELHDAQQQHDTALRLLDEAREKRNEIEATLAELEANSAEIGQRIDGLESRRLAADRETTEIKVELAKSEERLRNLRTRMRQFEESREERQRAIEEAREHLAECTQRLDASRWNILRAEAEIADLYLRKETFAAQTVGLVNRREALQQERGGLAERLQGVCGHIRKLEEKMHAAELAANEVRHERTSMADRLREDYGIEVADLEQPPGDEEQHQREEVQQEIEELRQKINNLGNVNLEALDELEQLEARYKTLSEQHADLSSAKASLEKIIERINADSRRLFSETLETVRGHFQTLFRDLFGGGQADVVLEENVDILDSGIEIVARPPGKELRSISLSKRRREDDDVRGASAGDFPQPPQPVLRARRGRRRVGRGQHRPLHQGAPGLSDLDAIHHRHALEEDDDLREHDLRRDDAGVGRNEAGLRPLRGRQRRRPHSRTPRGRRRDASGVSDSLGKGKTPSVLTIGGKRGMLALLFCTAGAACYNGDCG